MQFTVQIPLLLLTAAICLTVLFYLVKKLRVISSGIAITIIVAMIVWAVTGAIEHAVTSLDEKLFVTHIAYIAYAFLTPLWITFILTYTSRRQQWQHPLIIGLFVVFGIFVLCNWTNAGQLFYKSTWLEEVGGVYYFAAEYGPLFWVYTIFSYAVIIGMLVLIMVYQIRGKLKRRNTVYILIAVLLPIILNILYIAGVFVWDPTALGFIVSSCTFLLLYKGEFFSGLPLSHKTVVDGMGTGYVLMDSNKRVVEMNAAARRMLFILGDDEEAQAQNIILSKWRIDPAAPDEVSTVQQLSDQSHIAHYYRVSVNRISPGGGRCDYALLISDETALFNAKERMLYLERYDESTELYNRKYFIELLDKEIEKSKSGSAQTTVLACISVTNYADCCYFYGNDFGNVMIHSISRAIKEIIRTGDAISRFSLDEIYIFMRFDNSSPLTERIDVTMERIFKRFSESIDVGGMKIDAKLQIGIAYAPQHADTSDKLIALAGYAKKNVSRHMKYRYSVYHENTGDNYNRTLRLERDLAYAIERNQLYLMYQPQVDLTTGHVVGAEALLRWTHPELGAIVPVDFIPIAEESGLIREIGLWVIEQATAQLKAWRDAGLTDLKVSANVSLNQLADESFSGKVIDIVKASGIDPSKLELEITESLALFPEAMRYGHLQHLRAHNIRIAMDDFGMGHSSLAYIKQFELDTIKIDRVLTCDILKSSASVAMIRSVRMLCKSLGLDTIVEYVELPEQLSLLRELDCNLVQGYVYSPPLSPEACASYVKNSLK